MPGSAWRGVLGGGDVVDVIPKRAESSFINR
jgi:hypothetical protein